MKKIGFYVVLLGIGILFSSNVVIASSFGIKAGDFVKYITHGPNIPGVGTGGEFALEAKNGHTWTSFCLERYEYLNRNTWYRVGDDFASDEAIGGGNGAVNGADPISDKTAWLFWRFTQNTLPGYNGSDTSQRSLQTLIWGLEDELNLASSPYYTPQMVNWLALATAATGSGWTNDNGHGDYLVATVNLWGLDKCGNYTIPKQTQLIASAVPLPPAIIFFSSGLIGLIGIKRKFRA